MTDTTAPTPAVPEQPPPTGARFGWRAEQRPRPGFAHALGAAAGAFLVVALVAFVIAATSDDPTAPGVIFSLLLIAGAWLGGAWVPGPLRSACTTVLALTVPVLWIFAFAGGGTFGRDEFRGVLLLTTGSYLLLYLVGWTRGRGVFLAGTLLVLASWLAFEVAGSGGAQLTPFGNGSSTSNGTFGSSSSSSSVSLAGDSGNVDAAAAVTMLLGLAYLAFGAAFDSRRWAGLATPFVASRGENRRATTWIGALAVLGGMVAIIADLAPGSAAVGGIAVAFALALGAVAVVLAPRLGEPADGRPELPAS